MVAKKDFEQRYFDQLEENAKAIRGDIASLSKEVQKVGSTTNSIDKRLIKVEDKVFPAQKETVSQLPSPWRDPQVLKLLSYIAIAIVVGLIIFAGLKGIALPKGIL